MTETREALVSLSNAGVCVSDKWLVRGISLEVSRGEIVTLIGPNGSGKSTTAKMALGVIKLHLNTCQHRPIKKITSEST